MIITCEIRLQMSSPGIYSSRDSAFAFSRKQRENNATRITFRNASRVQHGAIQYLETRVISYRASRRYRDDEFASLQLDVYPKVHRRIRDEHALLLGRSWGYAARWGWLVTDFSPGVATPTPPLRAGFPPVEGRARPPRRDGGGLSTPRWPSPGAAAQPPPWIITDLPPSPTSYSRPCTWREGGWPTSVGCDLRSICHSRIFQKEIRHILFFRKSVCLKKGINTADFRREPKARSFIHQTLVLFEQPFFPA